jgi:ABC-2 type transport system ATP-binding protein
MAYTVITHGICKSFGDQVVLDHVDLTLESGSVLALLGPNGAGKTTMVHGHGRPPRLAERPRRCEAID